MGAQGMRACERGDGASSGATKLVSPCFLYSSGGTNVGKARLGDSRLVCAVSGCGVARLAKSGRLQSQICRSGVRCQTVCHDDTPCH